jgi:hypothetical protein
MLRAFWHRLFHRPVKTSCRGPALPRWRRPRAARPTLEVLEDRVTPSTFLVTNSTDNLMPGSLRYAITQANLPGNDGSTVRITNQVAGPIVLTEGELPINASMTIENLSGAPVEIRQDTADARVFHVAGPQALSVAVTGLTGAVTIAGGSVHDNGGGFLVDNPLNTLTLTDVNLLDNSAADGLSGGGNGGGIFSRGAVVLRGSVVGNTAAANRASQMAGGVWADRGLTLQASSVDGNIAGADGGGVLVSHGNVSLADVSSVSYNRAPDGVGGGIIALSGSVLVTGGSHVDGNAAKNNAGIQEGRGNVTVLGGSTVNGNSSTGQDTSTGDFGGGAISVTLGDVYISGSQVSNNHPLGMESGGIVSILGNVTVTDGSQVNGNTNAGPGGGIAANFGSTVTVSGGSQVNHNTGAAIGGGIVNFSLVSGSVTVSGGSQVNDNVLTNQQSLGQAIAVFLNLITSPTKLTDLAAAVGGAGGADLLDALSQVEAAASQAAPLLNQAVNELPQPPGLVVTGGGIGTLLAPISVTGGSQVDGNLTGQRVSGGNDRSVGLAGGVISILGAVTIDHSAVDGNRAPYGAGGGVLTVRGGLTIADSTINGNSAAGDGGGINNGASLTLTNSTVAGNHALGGAGIENVSGGTITMSGDTVNNNFTSFGDGGGIDNHGTLTVTNCTIAANEAANLGGGINNVGVLMMANSTVASNTVMAGGNGGGICNAGAELDLLNTIVFNPSSGGPGNDVFGTITRAQGDLFGSDVAGAIVSNLGGNQFNTNPLLGSLQNNGGPTATMSLLPGSPAIGAGAGTSLIPGLSVPTTDQRGDPRPANSIDIGAFQTQPPPAITSADHTTFALGAAGAFTVTTTGFPAPSLTESGPLPSGVQFIDNGNGTATLTGVPTVGGQFTFTITASNGAPPDATQLFTLTVQGLPAAVGLSLTRPSASLAVIPPRATLTLTATVTPATPGPSDPATGTVTFLVNGSTALGTAAVDGTGTATLTLNAVALPVAADTLTARYNGDATYAAALSPGVPQTVQWPLTTPGVDDTSQQTAFLKSTFAAGAPDSTVPLGSSTTVAISGDWDGTGVFTVSFFDTATATWTIRHANGSPDTVFAHGSPGDTPVAGDWNGTGKWGIGIFRPSTGLWQLRAETSPGAPDVGSFLYGSPGSAPVVGDWDGDGKFGIGVVEAGGVWKLKNVISQGAPGYTFAYGADGDQFVAGDWDGNGSWTPGVLEPQGGVSVWKLRDSNSAGAPDVAPFAFGSTAVIPLVGDWDFPALP